MKAIIKLDVPDWQIGQKVTVYFPDTTVEQSVCEAVKVRPRPEKLLPCKCGCKRREHWFGSTKGNDWIFICSKCGFRVSGESEIDVHAKWNKAIRELIDRGEVK